MEPKQSNTNKFKTKKKREINFLIKARTNIVIIRTSSAYYRMFKAWKQKLLLLIQLLLLLQHSVDSGSVVTHLPGFDGPLPFHLETGYIGVGEGEKIQLFYYFVKSENNPKEDPLLIWLTGGPACSAFTALGYQNGPFTFKLDVYDGTLPSLIPTSFSWTKEASIIFLDQPVGTGFSYSKTPLDDLPSDTGEAKQTYEFLQKWLLEYPEFASNPLYIGGDSYSGATVPAIVQEISLGNEHGQKPLLNLKGYILGNPATNEDDHDFDARIPFAHGMGLISDELYESIERSCKGNYFDIDPTSANKQCLKLMNDYDKCTSKLHIYNILVPSCGVASPNPFAGERIRRRDLRKLVHNSEPIPTPDCYVYRFILGQYWANDEDVRKALHVVKGSIGIWERCKTIPYNKDIVSTVPYHQNISIKGIYRSLIYSGDHDLFVPFTGTEAWIKSLNYSVIDEWRPWFGNNQVLGYTRTYANNMTFVTVKGGGHTADYKADESFLMFKRWIRGQSL